MCEKQSEGLGARFRHEERRTSINDAWKEVWKDGWTRGWKEAWVMGMQEGKAGMLLRLCVQRFGPVSEEVVKKLNAASSIELDLWADNFLDARTVEEVIYIH